MVYTVTTTDEKGRLKYLQKRKGGAAIRVKADALDIVREATDAGRVAVLRTWPNMSASHAFMSAHNGRINAEILAGYRAKREAITTGVHS